jgi:MFS family permease
VLIGAQGVLWQPLKQTLGLSDGEFGTILPVQFLVAVAILLQGGPLSAWAGKKYLGMAGLATVAAALLALAWTGGIWGFVGALALMGAGYGLLETAMNAVTLDYEKAMRRNVMNLIHASYSGGAVVGALGTGTLLEWEWNYHQLLCGLAVLAGLTAAITGPVAFPPGESAAGGPAATLRLLLSKRALVVLALVCLMGVVGESVANNWTAIYLRDALGASSFVGGLGLALCNGAMFVGRLLNAPLVARRGVRLSLLLSAGGLILSACVFLLPGKVPTAVAALVLLGMAVAGVVPTVLSAAAELAPGQSGAIAGGILATVYLGFVLSLPLVGWLAEFKSLQVALFGSVAFSGLVVIGLTRNIPGRATVPPATSFSKSD